MIRVFIGYDPREAAAFPVLAHSIHARSTAPVSIAPLRLSQLRHLHRRDRHPLQSTDFAFTRFLVPHLCGFEGWALFMDCDMLVRDDLARLWALRDARHAVQVVQHQHVPREGTKFLNQPQSRYEKKNWSSVMLFNNARCTALTPDYVDRASGLELHQFKWLDDDALIGALPRRWNHLVGYDAHDPEAAIAHFTLGGPYFPQHSRTPFGPEWRAERDRMLEVGDAGYGAVPAATDTSAQTSTRCA
jgi:lipopolysaccharide biosynthesis glycosyltransferase